MSISNRNDGNLSLGVNLVSFFQDGGLLVESEELQFVRYYGGLLRVVRRLTVVLCTSPCRSVSQLVPYTLS